MGKNKKKYSKTYFDASGKTICVDDLVKAVNECDKQYGIKLKHPDVWCSPESYRQVIEARADMYIAALMCAINGIPIKNYFTTDDSENEYGTICKPVGIMNVEFTDESVLNWENLIKTYNTDSLAFRCRFITLVLSSILGEMGKITEQEVIKRKKFFKHSRDEQRIIITKEVISDTLRFVQLMLQPNESYKNIILKMQEHLSYTKRKPDHRTLRNLINGHIIQLRKGMKKEPLTERFFSDDMAIYSILKISYMLATNKTNVDVLPKFKYIENATVKHNLIKLIEELGAEILYGTDGRKYSPMFKAFVQARPSIWSQFYKESEENLSIRVGIIAIEYTKFIMNDHTIDKFINEMKKKGK